MSYFEEREHLLLGTQYDEMYKATANIFRGITLNTLRCSHEKLMKAKMPIEPSAFCDNAYVLQDTEYKIGKHPYYHAGAYYIQEPSAASAAPLLGIEQGDFVLDTCAAPGGKTSQLACALGGTGILIANEYKYDRACVLASNLERMGTVNTVVTCASTDKLAQSLPSFFDKILVDAPCSGEGMFRKEPKALSQHSKALVEQCARLGAEILDNAAVCLAPGGTILYSTCTFSPDEDEGQIGAFLQRHSDFELVSANVAFGCAGEQNRTLGYKYDASLTRRIYPCHKGEGHFIAKLAHKGYKPTHNITSYKAKAPDKAVSDFILQYFPTLANGNYTTVNGKILLLPAVPLPSITHLQAIALGVNVGSLTNGRFIPSHSLFMAFGQDCINKELLTLSDARTAAWLHGEEIDAHTAKNGYCAVLIDDMPLGFGKVSCGKCKNHYPKGLRNLK